ncbi:MAG: UDP-N-acetylmuramate--L-alanine ligase [Actinobacteria bacterium]|nr:UDP-N-acetylmuramate--L-alanine ligase [Actinomycetota bacterium]
MSFSGRKLHLIGIGGAGMSGLALVAHGLGAEVSGSDRAESSYTERLATAGVRVAIGHDAANVPEQADIVYSTAIGEDNPEFMRARELGLKLLHRSDLLSELVSAKPRCIAVAGTHGKTTTTAMIAHMLSEIGADPSFFVGGEVAVGGRVTNAHWGDGDVVVVEADESDRSFLKLSPEVAVVTNVELDHHGTWGGGLDELLGAFTEFVAPARRTVVWRGQSRLIELTDAERLRRFGIEGDDGARPEDFTAYDVQTPVDEPAAGTRFTLLHEGASTPAGLSVRGDHNVLNALAALAAIDAAGLNHERAVASLAGFRGVARRFEPLGVSAHGGRVYDDYAHHPTEVRAALMTARGAAKDGRVIAVFQPHLFSRTASLARDFGYALALADVAIVMDVYPAREAAADFPGVSGWMVATATADARPGMRVLWQPGHDDVAAALDRELREGDLCITIGAGDVTRVGHSLVEGRP